MNLSDDELRARLVAVGFDAGPINESTRSFYVNLLNRRESGAQRAFRLADSEQGYEISPRHVPARTNSNIRSVSNLRKSRRSSRLHSAESLESQSGEGDDGPTEVWNYADLACSGVDRSPGSRLVSANVRSSVAALDPDSYGTAGTEEHSDVYDNDEAPKAKFIANGRVSVYSECKGSLLGLMPSHSRARQGTSSSIPQDISKPFLGTGGSCAVVHRGSVADYGATLDTQNTDHTSEGGLYKNVERYFPANTQQADSRSDLLAGSLLGPADDLGYSWTTPLNAGLSSLNWHNPGNSSVLTPKLNSTVKSQGRGMFRFGKDYNDNSGDEAEGDAVFKPVGARSSLAGADHSSAPTSYPPFSSPSTSYMSGASQPVFQAGGSASSGTHKVSSFATCINSCQKPRVMVPSARDCSHGQHASVNRRSAPRAPKFLSVACAVFFAILGCVYYQRRVSPEIGIGAGGSLYSLLSWFYDSDTKPGKVVEVPPAQYTICRQNSSSSIEGNEAGLMHSGFWTSMGSDGHRCIRPDIINATLRAAQNVQQMLIKKNFARLCGSGDSELDADGGLAFNAIATFVINMTSSSFDPNEVFDGVVYMMQENPSWGVQVVSAKHSESSLRLRSFSLPLGCRFKLFLREIVIYLMFLVLAVLFVGVFWLLQRRKLSQRSRRQQINSIVEDIIELLVSNAADKPDKPYLPILEIREALLPGACSDRTKAQLWNEVVDHFERSAERSRVTKEKQRIRGEWFEVWRWLPQTTLASVQPNGRLPPVSSALSGRWQGKAFEGTAGGSPLTSCLKISNMFSKFDKCRNLEWRRDVQREFLAKCGANHGVLHLGFDEDSHDGVIYAKMMSPSAAGEVYRKIHGCWFDRRLVTAKYLLEDRYHKRFPDAINCCEPLSNF